MSLFWLTLDNPWVSSPYVYRTIQDFISLYYKSSNLHAKLYTNFNCTSRESLKCLVSPKQNVSMLVFSKYIFLESIWSRKLSRRSIWGASSVHNRWRGTWQPPLVPWWCLDLVSFQSLPSLLRLPFEFQLICSWFSPLPQPSSSLSPPIICEEQVTSVLI